MFTLKGSRLPAADVKNIIFLVRPRLELMDMIAENVLRYLRALWFKKCWALKSFFLTFVCLFVCLFVCFGRMVCACVEVRRKLVGMGSILLWRSQVLPAAEHFLPSCLYNGFNVPSPFASAHPLVRVLDSH